MYIRYAPRDANFGTALYIEGSELGRFTTIESANLRQTHAQGHGGNHTM